MSGELAGTITILLVAGLPSATFAATTAHELAHAFMAEQGGAALPAVLSEGWAEYVAYQCLKHHVGSADGRHRMELMAQRTGDPYGDGLALIHRLVSRFGSRSVMAALASGDLGSVGLAPDGAPIREDALR